MDMQDRNVFILGPYSYCTQKTFRMPFGIVVMVVAIFSTLVFEPVPFQPFDESI